MVISSVPRPKKAPPEGYGEKKKNTSFMLTPTASEAIEKLAEMAQLTRSELVERLVRELVKGDQQRLEKLIDVIRMKAEEITND